MITHAVTCLSHMHGKLVRHNFSTCRSLQFCMHMQAWDLLISSSLSQCQPVNTLPTNKGQGCHMLHTTDDKQACMTVQMWQAVHLKPDSSLRRHLHPVCQLVYNSVYHEAISADESGLICVWKVSLSCTHTLLLHTSFSLHSCSARDTGKLFCNHNSSLQRVCFFSNFHVIAFILQCLL